MHVFPSLNVSLTIKLVVTSVIVEAVLLSFWVWNDTRLTQTQLILQKQQEVSQLSEIIADTVASAISHDERQEIRDIVEHLGHSPHINYAAIKTLQNETIAQSGNAKLTKASNQNLQSYIDNSDHPDAFHIQVPVRENNATLGQLDLEVDTTDINAILADVARRGILDAITIVAATAITLYLLMSALTKNLKNLTMAVAEYTDNRHISTPLARSGDEVGKLSATFEKLMVAIRSGEESLKESEKLLRAILDNSPTIIYVKDIEGKYLLINAQFAKFMHAGVDDILHKTDFELFPPEIATQLRDNDQKVLASKAINQMEELVPQDGELKTYISIKFCLFDKNNEPYAICGISTDISDRIRNEQRLKESEENLRSLTHNANDGILVNKQGQHVFTNQRMADILGTTVEEILGTGLEYVVYPSEKTNVEQRYKRRLKGQTEPIQYETLFVSKKTGEPVPVELTAFISQWDGEPCGVIFVRDIRERKQTEAELKRYREQLEFMVSERTAELESAVHELEAFSYSVSHDLRSPLRSIDGFSQLLLEDYQDKLDEHGTEYLNRVRKAAQRMAQLIDDILLLSRVSRHKLSITQVNLSDIAQESAASLKELYPQRDISIKIQPNMIAKGDRRLLRIIIDNLLDNAWKYTANTAHADVECGVTLENGNSSYYVKDNGIGFDMQYADKLFGAFQRLHAIDEFPGTGIGLATVKRIIDRHGGEIWAEGQPGKGAIFYFTLN